MAADNSGSSVQSFVTTLITNGVIFAVFLGIFICLKRKQTRVYQPRGTVESVPAEKKPDQQPAGVFGWFSNLLHKPENYVVQQSGVDGYFFLRYLFNFFFLSLIGGAITWAILFPVNASNGYHTADGSVKGFDIIGFVNVKNKYRYFAHAFVSWVFFGLVIYVIYRELFYYVSFRHALQATPLYDSLLSTRTLFLTDLPDKYQTEDGIRTLFPAAQNIWFARDHQDLEKLVKERTKLAGKYEGALNKVITKSMKLRAKAIKKNKEVPAPENELTAYIPEKKQPSHRLKFLIGKKVKTLQYGPEHLGELNQQIGDKQSSYTTAEKVGSAFLEFPSQLEAQRAYQAFPYAKELKKCQRIINAAPEDIVWENTGLSFYKRHIKAIIAKTVLTLLIIFWAIPVAVVGCISNINYLTSIVPFLSFINNMPSVLMGIITGLLPTILLAVLMALLPPFIRKMGRFSGLLTVQQVEFWTQSWYFGFQVVQVFLVTTLASAASTVVDSIISDPSSAMTLLAKYLPRASNFYIAYMLLQGLSVSSGALAQLVALILAQFLGKILDNTPRKQWNRYNTLGKPGWGTVYAVYQLMTVILLVYSIIAPIIIVFSAITFFLIYVAFLYNLTYVLDHSVDSRGRAYPKALFQTFVGLYLGEICLLGLFIMAKSWGPVALEGVALAATVAAHLYFKHRFIPLLDAVPISALTGGQGYNNKDQGLAEVKATGKAFFVGDAAAQTYAKSDGAITAGALIADNEKGDLHSNYADQGTLANQQAAQRHSPLYNDNDKLTQESGLSSPYLDKPGASNESAAPTFAEAGTATLAAPSQHPAAHTNELSDNYTNNGDDEKGLLSRGNNGGASTLENNLPTNLSWFKRFIHPSTYLTLPVLARLLPDVFQSPVRYSTETKSIYVDPAVSDPEPQIWIPKDPVGLSTVQVEKAHANGVNVTDENATIDDKAAINWYGPPPDYEDAVKQ